MVSVLKDFREESGKKLQNNEKEAVLSEERRNEKQAVEWSDTAGTSESAGGRSTLLLRGA